MAKALILFFLVTSNVYAQKPVALFGEIDNFLSKHVRNGKVDYKSIKENPAQLKELVSTITSFDLSKVDKNVEMAFWINAYNVLVINTVVQHYAIKSPMDVKGFFDTRKHCAAGEELTLNDIENIKLREKFGDARIHFALVCAAESCPPIINGAYCPKTLDEQLDERTKSNLNDENFIRVDSKANKAAISEIFKWYKGDFTTGGTTVLQYINQYREDKIPEDYEVGFYQYDWSLNEAVEK